jgi:uncharacterized protein (DUF302 family)
MYYGFHVHQQGSVDQVVERVTEELKKEGFGVLSDIDVQATLKNKIGVQRRPYRILGVCNPHYAAKALEADEDLGLLLPCNVIVREEADGTITVGFMDPEAVLAVVDNPFVEGLSQTVRQGLMRVRDALDAPA